MAKKPSRTMERKRLLDEAASITMPSECDVIVVGGGAAGLVAAITAAEAGASVLVLERDLSCGRSILATGGGRCNFANIKLDPRRFNCPEFVDAVCGTRWLDDVLAFFRASGMRWSLEDDRLYPMSRSAASVRNVLLSRARAAGVVLASAREVVGYEYIDTLPPWPTEEALKMRDKDPYYGMSVEVSVVEAFSEKGLFLLPNAQALVLATGGGPVPPVSDLKMGWAPLSPALCPIACADSPLSVLDGRRVHATATLTKAGSFFPSWRERGEVLFRSYGLSGIVTFDLSRRAEAGDLVELDLVPDLSNSELRQLVDPFASGSFSDGCLDGVIDPEIARVLEGLARERWHIEWPERAVPKSDSEALMSLAKALPFLVTGLAEIDRAQVMRGGLSVEQFDPETLASREHPWLFACGEALDVDADCGGYNLGWAWKSGMVAGAAAARWAKR